MPPSGSRSPAPELTGSALDAVRHRGSHIQIIASAGSGKTEVVSQRVADLLAEGLPAESIVAFTFTERAAAELRSRIAHRVEDRLGTAALDRLAGLFVGTIHAFCFRLLQQVPRYETYDGWTTTSSPRSCPGRRTGSAYGSSTSRAACSPR
jgi:DNA helicase-2/ATP-dependent DNA helicase PcrA